MTPGAAPAKGNPKQTMMGMAPVPGAGPPPGSGFENVHMGPKGLHGTMLMGAGAGPAAPPGVPPAGMPSPFGPGGQDAPGAPPGMKRTMMGIARPGIAPLRPGENKPSPEPPAPPPAELSDEELRLVGGSSRPGRGRALLAVLVVVVIAAGLGVLLVGGWLADRGPIKASVVLADDGAEQVELSCESCPDGTAVSLGFASARFANRTARLALDKPLRVGSNPLVFELKRPGESKAAPLAVDVPVHYRVRGDLEGLSEDPPKLKVHVEAATNTSASVAGQPLALDAQGRGTYAIDVSEELTGASRDTAALNRTVPYRLTAPGGEAVNGDVKLQVGIVPLVVDAPGASTVVDQPNFMLAGRTQEGGTVTVAGRPISVDANGTFAQLMSVSAPGETTVMVRSSVRGRAPRLVPVKVRRVTSLRAELAGIRKSALSSYEEALKAAGSKPGVKAALEGKVNEARSENHVTIVLLDVARGCRNSPCLARVLLGSKVGLNPGESVTAVGDLSGLVDGPRRNEKIPELIAEFLVRGTP